MAFEAGILEEFILESLSFKAMTTREEEVADSHGSTFDWILTPDQNDAKKGLGDHFTRWLSSDNLGSIYWITGKPGSGKSTLMRYIAEHPSTDKLLKSWAGEASLARANYYFWTSGSEEQRSHTGLLRYLLHQLLSSHRGLIPTAFPDLWQSLCRLTTKDRIKFRVEWIVSDLAQGFYLFLKNALPTIKVCIFVDGLDEFGGDHGDIIGFFRDIAEGEGKSRVKMCLSSRQWEVFERAFAHSVPNLRLQDLTYRDMWQYVRDNLQDQYHHSKEQGKLDRYDDELLTQQILQQADGVFLWVRLVVRYLAYKVDLAQTLTSEIKALVEELPSDLDELFDKLLFSSQSEEDLVQTSYIFQLVRAREVAADFVKDETSNSLTIWEFAHAYRAEEDALVLEDSIPKAPKDESLHRCFQTKTHIEQHAKGLLEIYDKARDQEERVKYLHRTIRDYLMLSTDVWTRLMSHSASSFDPHLRLLRSYVLRLKRPLHKMKRHRRLDEWYPHIALSLTHARYIATDPSGLQIPFINEMDKAISSYWEPRTNDAHDHWARSCFGTYEERRGNKIIFTQPFLALCTRFGLEEYVLGTLDSLSQTHDSLSVDQTGANTLRPLFLEETPLLSYALEFLTSRKNTLYPLTAPSFVSSLLRNPCLVNSTLSPLIGEPNRMYSSPLTKRHGVTPWIMVLRHLRDAKRRGWIDPEGTERWTKVVRLLVQDGNADLEAVVKGDGWDPEASARDIIMGQQQLGGVDDKWINGLKELFED
ncbi:hypothetical protein BJ170DRAFT_687373 [Xylariales sp. AK1849]|nr:hypothetical protein BJ170DRAFT_687373 [Xylariales sp. AK1849]